MTNAAQIAGADLEQQAAQALSQAFTAFEGQMPSMHDADSIRTLANTWAQIATTNLNLNASP